MTIVRLTAKSQGSGLKPRVKPTKGHRFNGELRCVGCGISWENSQRDPEWCPNRLEHTAKSKQHIRTSEVEP